MEPLPSTRLVGAVFAGGALLAAALVSASLLGSRGGPEPAPAVNAALAGAAEAGVLLRGIPQDGIVLGAPHAPVTLIEYADLQCPYCAVWARDAFPALVDRYVRSGRVRLVFRGLAFIGPESELALRTALAAGRQGRLWNVVHLLYANQGPENGGWVTEDLLRRVGSTAGLNPGRLRELRDSERVDRELLAAQRAADGAGVRGTPSFQAGPTGGRLELLPVTSLGPEEIAARLDELLQG